jgi:DNA-binding CsgD family transcriptional regulator
MRRPGGGARQAEGAHDRPGARSGRVEVVQVRVGPDLADCYVPTGTAWRAVLASDGRVMFYPDVPRGLTVREREVATLVAEGLTSKQIGRRLFISKRTVDAHLRHAYAKTGTNGKVGLVNWLADHPPGSSQLDDGAAKIPS